MKVKLLHLLALTAVLAALPAEDACGQGKAKKGLRLHKVGVFAGKAEEVKGAQSAEERVPVRYALHFSKDNAAYLTTQVTFANEMFGVNEFDYEVMMGLYTYDNRPISANKKKMVVASNWKYAWTSQTYGWEESGRWSVGTYRVKVWVDGEKVGETAFYVFDPSASEAEMARDSQIEIEKLELYEGGDFFRPGLTKVPATKFARRTTRRVFWVARGRNELYQVRAQRPNVVGYYYKPDGTLMGEAANRYLIAPEVQNIVLVEGVGWPTPGNWDVGEYRFELEQDNRLVAERTFEITDRFAKPRTAARVVHYGVLDAGAFAGEVTIPDDDPARLYQKSFDAEALKYVWVELVLANNPNHAELHSHQVRWEFIGPGGVLAGQAENDFTILPEWKTARQKASFGHDDPKQWKKGHYKVRISIDGRLERVVRFEVK